MTSDLSESFFVGTRGNLANYCLFKFHNHLKRWKKVEIKGVMILTLLFGAYYPNIQVGVGKYAHTQCCYCAQSELVTWPHYPIRTVGFFNSSFLEHINPTFKWDWANKPKLIVVVVPRSSNQTWRVFYLTSWVNLLKVGLVWFRIYTC